MRQNIRQLLLLPIGLRIAPILYGLIITSIPITPITFAAAQEIPLSTASPTPKSRLISEMPPLRQPATSSSPTPAIALTPPGLSFSIQQGASPPPPQILTVRNQGGGIFIWNATTNATWLSLSPAYGSGNGTVTITPVLGSLGVGTHTSMVTVTAPGAPPVSVPISLTVTPAPVPPAIGVSATSLSFTAQLGGSPPAPQPLSIRNTGGGTLNWTASDNAAWLTLAPASGSGNGTVTITPVLGSLGVGTHTSMVTVTAPGAPPVSVPISLTVTPAPVPPAIGVSATSLSFTAQLGGSPPAPQPLSIRNTGGGTLNWTASDNAAWLTLAPASGSGNGTVTITPVLGSLGVGTHTSMVTVTAPGAPPVSVPISLTVTPAPVPPAIGVSATSLSFTAQLGGSPPAPQPLSIRNTGGGTLNWTASDNAAWLTLAPASGSGNGTVTITPVLGSLGVGTHTSMVTVTAPGAPPVSVPISLTVTPAPVPPAIGVSATSLSFTAQLGGSPPAPQPLSIRNTGGGTLNWTASDNAAWLTLAPASGSGNGTVTITPVLGSLGVGTHTSMVTVTAPGAPPVSVPISLTVTPAPISITVSPSSLAYTGVSGSSNPASQSVSVISNGNWIANVDAAWLTLNPTSGSGNGTLSARVNLESTPIGVHTATITITAGGITRTVHVTLTVSTAFLSLSPSSLTFTATQGATNPPPQNIIISSNGRWTANHSASWLSLNPSTGSNNGTITASINTTNAVQGTNQATITVISGGITRTATVTLTLNPPSTSSATLTWRPNGERDLAGYKVYRSTVRGQYDQGKVVATIRGNVTTYQTSSLQLGNTYFFVVTAFDVAGNESGYSNEVSKSIY